MRQHIVCGSRRKQGWVTATTLCNKTIYTSFIAKPCLSYLGSGCTFLILGIMQPNVTHKEREKNTFFRTWKGKVGQKILSILEL